MNIFRFASLKLGLLLRTEIHFCTKKFVTSEVRNKFTYLLCLFYSFCKFKILRENRHWIKKCEIWSHISFCDILMFTTWFHEHTKNQFRFFTNSWTTGLLGKEASFFFAFSKRTQLWLPYVWRKWENSFVKVGKKVCPVGCLSLAYLHKGIFPFPSNLR